MSKNKKTNYKNPSKVTKRKMTPEEIASAKELALEGLKNTYSKFDLNICYGKEYMPEMNLRIKELEAECNQANKR